MGSPPNRTAGHGARWPYQALGRLRPRHEPEIVLSLRRGGAEAAWAPTRDSALVQRGRARVDHGHARNPGDGRSGKLANPARRRGLTLASGRYLLHGPPVAVRIAEEDEP